MVKLLGIWIVVGGIFDLHGTANQISKGSQKVELAKLLGIWKKIGLAHTQTFQLLLKVRTFYL